MLLLLPYRDPSIARNAPAVTIAIALLCIFVYFARQGGDAQIEQRAYEYYAQGTLAEVELPRYRAYLALRTDAESAQRLHLLGQAHGAFAYALLQSDAHFLADLHAGRVVQDSDPLYAQWKEQRQRFDALVESTAVAHYELRRALAGEPLRFITYAFLHGSVLHLAGNLLVLLLVGPFVEAALGRTRFALAYLAGGAAAGAMHVLFSDQGVIGASGAIASCVSMLALLYGTRSVPVFYWILIPFGTARIPALALLPFWLLNEGLQWHLQARTALPGGGVAYGAHVGGLCAGVALAWLLQPRSVPDAPERAPRTGAARRGSTLQERAQEAAARLDIRRATLLYRELVEEEPKSLEYLGAYLNVAILGADQEALRDAALRLLWLKASGSREELRRLFVQLTQPKILACLPIDEHLRLARRLVKVREDAAALRLIDAVLRDDHLRALYARQLADCLLGLHTAYAAHGLHTQANEVRKRLEQSFPSVDAIGGMAPTSRPPSTLMTSLRPTIAGLPGAPGVGHEGNTAQAVRTQFPRS